MSKNTLIKSISTFFSIAMGIMWFSSGFLKVKDNFGTKQSILGFEIIHGDIVDLVAILMPILEIILGIFFILGIYLRHISVISIVAMIFFIAILISARLRNLNINCGCFGAGDPYSDINQIWIDVLRDIIFLVIFIFIFIFPTRFFSYSSLVSINQKRV